jgi:hypothetical protein
MTSPSAAPPALHILMYASYTSARELPENNTRLTGKSIAYFLTRDAAVKFIDTRRAGFEGGGEVDVIREICQADDGQAYGVAYWVNVEKRGLAYWIHSDIKGHAESSTATLDFIGKLATRFGGG